MDSCDFSVGDEVSQGGSGCSEEEGDPAPHTHSDARPAHSVCHCVECVPAIVTSIADWIELTVI